MHKRLEIAKRLLSDKGVVFISIDDNEQAQLKMLCDKVFGESNYVGDVIWKSSDNSNNDAKQFSSDHNYTLVYSKISGWLTNKIDRTEDQQKHYKNPDNDPKGLWFDGNPISSPNPRPNLCYEIETPNGNCIKPPKNGWRWSKETLQEKMESGEIFFNENFTNIKRKTYLNEQIGLPPSSLWVDLEQTGHNRQAKYELLKIFPEKTKNEVFTTPKPVKLLTKILQVSSNNNSKILDFFAGSGTTLHATMQLNAEDGGNRQCILVTNNENNICEEVTYERNRRVIQGYTNAKGERVNGLTNNNLRYYKSDYVPSQKTEQNKRLLTRASTELLQIKEDCYTDITSENGFDGSHCKLFTNERGKYLIVLFHSRKQLAVIELLVEWIKCLTDATEKIRLYGFSPEKETLVGDFWEVADKIEAVPLPEAIYNAYRATFKTIKLNKKPATASTDDNLETDEE
jgi:adenine-specific DNA-methyltransferase